MFIMKNKLIYPEYFILEKDFNTSKIKKYDVLKPVFNTILTSSGEINNKNFYYFDDNFEKKKIESKLDLYKFLYDEFMRRYWSRCEWEFIVVDWPYKNDSIKDSNPIKIDAFEQLKPNLNIITDVVWNFLCENIWKKIDK